MMALLAAVVAGAVPLSAWAQNYYSADAFGQQISIPKSVASGTVLARHYITPIQACGQTKCTATSFNNFPNGGSLGTGPTITTNVSGVSTRLLINGQMYATGTFATPIEFTQPLEVQLLSDGRTNTGGSLAGEMVGSPFYFSFRYSNGDLLRVYLGGRITPIDGTCSVPAQTVTLLDATLKQFGDVGSTVGTQSFQIRINNCPQGYNRVGYTLNPTGGVIANAPGVLPLTAGSTARGVKIRVADNKGVPAIFGTSINVVDYNKATGGSYTIPMEVSYVKTDATIQSGTVNGAMTVLLDYQ
ncbi:type 1 fimbrial protein [Trinickia violacea]|uniref:Type 1 fimbrial protein n=2 Tax=Trinickia violacea TaxID=2571746 RepID=A0A4P8J317_9BURK|nr:type 1 fimbrial protein [Trinickia violacea]